jgi:hypothetical protein
MLQNTKMILLDFDKTLTKAHTGGAVLFRKDDALIYFDQSAQKDVDFASNNALGDAAALWTQIRSWILEKNLCVAVLTMADNEHASLLAESLLAVEKSATHAAVGGEEMVWRWLNSIACAYVAAEKSKRPDLCIDAMVRQECAVLESARLLVVARFNSSSKQSHLNSALQTFSDRQVLPREMLWENVLYIDDCLALLNDMKARFPSIKTLHVTSGLDAAALQKL